MIEGEMEMENPGWLGIDPGKSGAFAYLPGGAANYSTLEVDFIKLSETEYDVAKWLFARRKQICFAILERVSTNPRDGKVSAFKFGTSYGFCRGLLTAARIPYEEFTPKTWQTKMKCLTRGDKNVSKAAALRIFPNSRIIHANADAILLTELAKRTWIERNL